MKCPVCGSMDNKVIDSRPTENSAIRRRRECNSCKNRFTTYEMVEMTPLFVIKKDGSREVFDKRKIMTGLIKSCYKQNVKNEDLDALVDDIEAELLNNLRSDVSTREIGEMVMVRLQKLDEVSYVRFASVYREFKDIDTFLHAINQLRSKN
ncbi:MAG: transcriptional repressor NrdR [Clostridia bacterium]|nr:transcriptional repressor NrdR [Clostridia bacterium]